MRKTLKFSSSLFKNCEDQLKVVSCKILKIKKKGIVLQGKLTLSNFLFSRKRWQQCLLPPGKKFQQNKSLVTSVSGSELEEVQPPSVLLRCLLDLDWDLEREFDNMEDYQLLPDKIRLKSARTKYIIKTFLTLISIRSFPLRCILFKNQKIKSKFDLCLHDQLLFYKVVVV